MFFKKVQKNRGFTLLVAIVTTSMLLIIAFTVVNIAVKQLVISSSNRESQHAFYSADSGIECALYWDLVDSTLSKFSTTTAGTITCNGQSISTGSQPVVPTFPTEPSLIGGGTDSSPTSIFYLTFTKGCVIVRVTKSYTGPTLVTTIDSRGYNTCDTTYGRRVERGVTLSY